MEMKWEKLKWKYCYVQHKIQKQTLMRESLWSHSTYLRYTNSIIIIIIIR